MDTEFKDFKRDLSGALVDIFSHRLIKNFTGRRDYLRIIFSLPEYSILFRQTPINFTAGVRPDGNLSATDRIIQKRNYLISINHNRVGEIVAKPRPILTFYAKPIGTRRRWIYNQIIRAAFDASPAVLIRYGVSHD